MTEELFKNTDRQKRLKEEILPIVRELDRKYGNDCYKSCVAYLKQKTRKSKGQTYIVEMENERHADLVVDSLVKRLQDAKEAFQINADLRIDVHFNKRDLIYFYQDAKKNADYEF